MIKKLANWLVPMVVVLIGITFISFILANIAPINPAEAYARQQFQGADEELIEKYSEELGFNDPIYVQYFNWVKKALRFDFGCSYISKQPVTALVFSKMPMTLAIAITAAVLIVVFAVPLGMAAAKYQNRWQDKVISTLSFISISLPGYFLGLLLLLLLGKELKIMPIIGHGHPLSILCAALVLALPAIAMLSKTLRALIIENKEKDYVTYAKARGVSHKKIMRNHLLRNALPSCITMYGQSIGYLIVGTAIVEGIFSLPGLGQYVLNAALNRDFPVINAYLFISALFFVICNLLADIAGMAIDPTLRLKEDRS